MEKPSLYNQYFTIRSDIDFLINNGMHCGNGTGPTVDILIGYFDQ
jgi:hypothetical protein